MRLPESFLGFREKLRGLPKWQKVLLVLVAALLPAGIALATILLLKFTGKRG